MHVYIYTHTHSHYVHQIKCVSVSVSVCVRSVCVCVQLKERKKPDDTKIESEIDHTRTWCPIEGNIVAKGVTTLSNPSSLPLP